jgi:predicted ribosome quality control (RQC) complex YloA/Tae2 family protein
LRYTAIEREELRRRRSQELVRSVRRIRDRQQRKLAAQREELRRSENMEEVRRRAELMQANLYRVKRGDRLLRCENYYEPDCPPAEIPLDPLKTPQQNLAAAFKEYRKLKGAREHLTALTAEGEKLLDYLNSVLEELDRAENEPDLSEIRLELEKAGILLSHRGRSDVSRKKSGKARKSEPRHTGQPLSFETPDGLEVLVGRTNIQNDILTGEVARRTDYWFHVKELHGSHVILRCEGRAPSEAALECAAKLAARYSQAAGSGKVAVDYCMVRDVKKPSGALPGRVIYSNYHTLVVEC